VQQGDRYNHWTVTDITNHGDGKVACVCKCGTEKRVHRHKLRSNQSKSCGCYKIEAMRGKTWPDLAPEIAQDATPGARFGRWTVVSEPEAGKNRTVGCECDCGTTRDVVIGHLLTGRTKSCGCLRRDGARALHHNV